MIKNSYRPTHLFYIKFIQYKLILKNRLEVLSSEGERGEDDHTNILEMPYGNAGLPYTQ